MVHGIAIAFLFVLVVTIAAVFVAIWVIWTTLRVIVGGTVKAIGVGAGGNRRRQIVAAPPPLLNLRCLRQGCWANNPSDARFCRRCGNALPNPQRVVVRRAAVW